MLWRCCCCRTIIYSEQHVLLMWSIAFYIAENFVHQLREMDFVTKFFQVVAVLCVFWCCREVNKKRSYCRRTTRRAVSVETVRNAEPMFVELPLISPATGEWPSRSPKIRYDTIRDAILTCAWKPTWIGLIYHTEMTTKNCKTEKLKSKNSLT